MPSAIPLLTFVAAMAKVRFRLNNPAPEKLTSILVELYISRAIRPVFATGEHCKPENWDGARVIPSRQGKPTKGDAANINRHLANIEADLMDVWRDNKGADRDTLKGLCRQVVDPSKQTETEDPTQKKTSLFTVGRFLAQCKRELDPKTVKRYRVLWRVLGRFQKGNRLDFSQFDMAFHDRFKNFLYDTSNPNYTGYHLEYNSNDSVYVVTPGAVSGQHIGLLDEVVFKYLVILKGVCDWAADRGYVVHQSYKTWQIIKREYPPISLTLSELEAVENVTLGNMIIKKQRDKKRFSDFTLNLDAVRDILVFACRTGQRISDIRRFSSIQVVDDTWTFTQRKGNRTKIKTIEIPFTGYCLPALLILQKYNYKLPRIAEADINLGIKEVCKRAGIDKEIYIERWAGSKKIRIYGKKYEYISTHTGKKSFITILAGEGVPVSVLSEFTGTSQKTIERHYLGKTDKERVKGYLNKVSNQAIMRKAN